MRDAQSEIQNPKSKIVVRVPATSANLGAGFDVLGLALGLHNDFTVSPSDATRIEIEGHGEGLPLDESNLFYRAFAHLYSLMGCEAPAVHILMNLRTPPGLGLGSSATAVVGGLVAANALASAGFSNARLLKEAIALEHGAHADNVAPALLGGLVVNAIERGEVISVRVPFPEELKAVLFMPDFAMDTVQGRLLMPEQYSRADAIFSTSRVGLFVAAITQRRYDLLRTAMEDRLHQPYRARLFPQLSALIQAALNAGAHGACLSGGGSSVLALATGRVGEISAAMKAAAEAGGISGSAKVLDIDQQGARVDWEEGEAG